MNTFNSIPDNSDIYYTYDGSFDGLLTVIYTAVYSHIVPSGIFSENHMQYLINARYIDVKTDCTKAKKVNDSAFKAIGKQGMHRLYYVFISNADDKDIIIYRYLMLGFKNKAKTNITLTNDVVLSACKIAENVSRETEKFRQFTRFTVFDNGLQYARIAPQNSILPVLTPFFVQRLKSIPFVIHDLSHDICSVYNTKSWFVTSSDSIVSSSKATDDDVKRLWNTFFNSISIKERENKKLQQQMMGSRYFKDVWSIK